MSSQTKPRDRNGKRLIGSYVEPEIAERLAAIAEAEDRTVAYIIRRAVQREIESEAA